MSRPLSLTAGGGILDRAGLALALALPPLLLWTRAGADAAVGIIGGLFLLHMALRRPAGGWPGLRLLAGAAGLWWGWLLLTSALRLPDTRPLLQAALSLRFPLLAAALGCWCLRGEPARRAMLFVVGAAAGWIALECWQQYLTGANLFGWPRWGDGSLTGPFRLPRAGPEFVLVLYPALVPAVSALLARRRLWARAAGLALVLLALGTAVLIGQRMPALLAVFGLLVWAALSRRVRLVALAALAGAAVLIAALPVLSPPTWGKLVLHFTDQMGHFGESPYGVTFIRALVMILAHPLLGLGFDGFRLHCDEAQYLHGLFGVPDAVADAPYACAVHPHNHYLEAATAGGWPGLALFAAAVVLLLAALGRGMRGEPRRVGLFVAVFLALWPLASTSAFFTLPNAGWLFLLIGWALAEARGGAAPPVRAWAG